MMIKAMLVVFWMIMLPAFVGVLLLKKNRKGTWIEVLLFGYIVMFSVGELVTLPMIALNLPLHVLVWTLGGIYLLLAISGGVLLVRRERSLEPVLRKESVSLYHIGAIVLIGIQMYVVMRYLHVDGDDCLYVGTATTGVYTDTIFYISPYTGIPYPTIPRRYILSSYLVFLSVISKLCLGLHPSILAHMFFAPVFVGISYLMQMLFAEKWFPGKKDAKGIYLLLTAVMSTFAGYSAYNTGSFQLLRIWQGKAFLAAVFLPLAFYLWLDWFEEQPAYHWWIQILLNLACCYLSSMGIMLSVLLSGVFLLLHLIRYRSIRGLIRGAVCVSPSVLLGLVYILLG